MTLMLRTAAVAALAFVLAACGAEEEPNAARERPIVVATTTQLGDIVRQVAGDAADVHQILQANTDPHEYEPRPDDIRAAAGAKLVVASGSGLDDWMETWPKRPAAIPPSSSLRPNTRRTSSPVRTGGLRVGPALVARPAQRRGRRRGDP